MNIYSLQLIDEEPTGVTEQPETLVYPICTSEGLDYTNSEIMRDRSLIDQVHADHDIQKVLAKGHLHIEASKTLITSWQPENHLQWDVAMPLPVDDKVDFMNYPQLTKCSCTKQNSYNVQQNKSSYNTGH